MKVHVILYEDENDLARQVYELEVKNDELVYQNELLIEEIEELKEQLAEFLDIK
jgi:hypothetical protein